MRSQIIRIKSYDSPPFFCENQFTKYCDVITFLDKKRDPRNKIISFVLQAFLFLINFEIMKCEKLSDGEVLKD